MKKLFNLLLLLITTISFGQYEPFDYTMPGFIGGNLTTTDTVGSNNWLTHSNALINGTGTIDVLPGSLTYNALTTSTGNKVFLPGNNTTTPRDINKKITITGTIVYYSVLINVIDNTQLSTTTPGYFMGMATTSGVIVSRFVGRLGIISSNFGINYRLSIQNTSGGIPNWTEYPINLEFGITYLIVVKYDTTTYPTNATLWVNPSNLGTTEPISNITNNSGTSPFTTISSFFLRNSYNTPKVEIDEIRVGTTWSQVTPTASLSTNQNQILGLRVYPNPTKETLNILTNSNLTKNVKVYDMIGKEVINTQIENQLNVSCLTTGMYVAKITEDGKTSTIKLVIQ
jgi:hypothetical protein